MGCGGSKVDGTTKEIDKQIQEDRRKAKAEVKILLLGSGESGKTTILKQMKLIHDHGFNHQERENFREVICSNVRMSVLGLLAGMDRLGIALEGGLEKEKKAFTADEDELVDAPVDFAAAKALWQDPGAQAALKRRREFHLLDCAEYLMANLDRISSSGYLPTDEDILRCRVKTTGITETKFRINDLIYNMVDVGGQRSERRKWIHCFENVTTVIFVVAVSTFDEVLIEDESVNRMHEALTLFDSICNGKWFSKTSMILFLNKIDLLKAKLETSQLSDYFPDFTGPNEFQPAVDFFSDKFKNINQVDSRSIYIHCTCATDTDQIRFVMAAVNDMIMQKNLRNIGLL